MVICILMKFMLTWARFLSLAWSKLRLCSAIHRPIITEVTCPVPITGQAQPELTLSKRQKTGPDMVLVSFMLNKFCLSQK